jgi:hypothetical protein
MRFKNQVQSPEQWAQYESLLRQLSGFLDDWVDYLIEVFEVVQAKAASDTRLHHGTVLLLTRHLLECIDALVGLTEKGSAQLTGPVLRSAFEAYLGVHYILEADSERRGLAYQVAYAHKRIKVYRKLDPEHQSGKDLRARLKDDPLASTLPGVSGDLPAMAAGLEGMLAKPEYALVEAEWQAVRSRRKGNDPSWFSLFGGPGDIQRLAEHLGKQAMYELLYRPWSDMVHAGNAFENMGLTNLGEQVYRPLRHPDGLQQTVVHASSFCLATAKLLLDAYAPDERPRFAAVYQERLRSRHLNLASRGQIINAPWK